MRADDFLVFGGNQILILLDEFVKLELGIHAIGARLHPISNVIFLIIKSLTNKNSTRHNNNSTSIFTTCFLLKATKINMIKQINFYEGRRKNHVEDPARLSITPFWE